MLRFIASRFIFLLLVASSAFAPRAHAFRIIIDVNQITPVDADVVHAENSFRDSDGVWVYKDSTFLSESQWRRLLDDLGARKRLITEDAFVAEAPDPFNTSSYSYATTALQQPVSQAMVYLADDSPLSVFPWDSVLHVNPQSGFNQIISASGRVNHTPLIIHTRSYLDNGIDRRQSYVDFALDESHDRYVGGAVMEFNPITYMVPGNPRSGRLHGDTVNALGFMHEVLSEGKDCYLLLAPARGETNYAQAVLDTVTFLYGLQGSLSDPEHPGDRLLQSPNLFVVLAAYDRSTNSVDFVGRGPNGYRNSVLAAKDALISFKASRAYRMNSRPISPPGGLRTDTRR